jgi:hypothetical protein
MRSCSDLGPIFRAHSDVRGKVGRDVASHALQAYALAQPAQAVRGALKASMSTSVPSAILASSDSHHTLIEAMRRMIWRCAFGEVIRSAKIGGDERHQVFESPDDRATFVDVVEPHD